MRFSLSDALAGYRGVVFDLDGTLLDLQVDWPGLRAELSAVAGLDCAVAGGIRDLLNAIQQNGGARALEEAFAIVRRFELASLDRSACHRRRVEAVRSCAERGQHLALFTANMRATADAALAFLDLQDVFEPVVAGDTVKRRKPDPEGLARIVRSWGLPPNRIAYVADGDHEVGLAGQVGVAMFQV